MVSTVNVQITHSLEIQVLVVDKMSRENGLRLRQKCYSCVFSMYIYITNTAGHSCSRLYCTYTQHVQKAWAVQYSKCEEYSRKT